MAIGLQHSPPSVDPRQQWFDHLTQNRLERAYRLAAAVLHDPVEAEDAVSDAAILAWAHWRELRDPDRFDRWFDRILINECRKRLRRHHLQPITELAAAGSDDPTERLVQRDALRRALATLSFDHGVVVVLRFVEDLSLADIAERVRAREGTVKSRLHYALRCLRAAYAAGEREERNKR